MRRLLLLALLAAGAARAQVTATTPDQLSGIPPGFLPSAKVPDFSPRGTPKGYKVNPDPHDFTSSYVTAGGGPPPGGAGGPPPGGGAPGGGPAGSSCIPNFGGGAYAAHMISSPGRLTVVSEMNHSARRIYIGGTHPADVKPTYMGDSIGHWDGKTLVTDTIDIKSMPGIDLKERWTKLPNGSIEDVAIPYDASGKQAGAPQTTDYVWRPDLSYVEDICEDFGEAFSTGLGYGGKPSSFGK